MKHDLNGILILIQLYASKVHEHRVAIHLRWRLSMTFNFDYLAR